MTRSSHSVQVVPFVVDTAAVPIRGFLRGVGDGARPAVVLCPGIGGTQDTPAVVAAAEAFARAGVISATFDHRGFGVSAGQPRQVVSVRRQLDDIATVLRHLRSLATVDADRTALWGTSLGGGHALTVAASDRRLAAVVVQAPFNGFPRRVRGRSQRQAYALLWAAVRDQVRGWAGRGPSYVKAVGHSDELALMTGTDATAIVAKLDSATWRNQIAPRCLLELMRYHPGHGVHRITAPLLVCLARLDAETTAATTAHLASTARNGRQLTYDTTHFGLYRGEVRQQLLHDQTAFLRRALNLDASRFDGDLE